MEPRSRIEKPVRKDLDEQIRAGTEQALQLIDQRLIPMWRELFDGKSMMDVYGELFSEGLADQIGSLGINFPRAERGIVLNAAETLGQPEVLKKLQAYYGSKEFEKLIEITDADRALLDKKYSR